MLQPLGVQALKPHCPSSQSGSATYKSCDLKLLT